MAIAFDAATNGSSVTATSYTLAHTCTGTNRFLVVGVVGVAGAATSNNISGVTYAGVAMTKIGEEQLSPNDRWFSIWYLYNPASGANNIVVSSSSSAFIAASAASYNGVAQSAPEVTHKSSQATGSPLNEALTTLSDNAWHIGAGGTASGTPTAGTGTTRRAVNGGANLAVFDNGGAITPAGSNTIQMTGMNSSFGSILWGMSLAPYVAAATSTYPALELAGN